CLSSRQRSKHWRTKRAITRKRSTHSPRSARRTSRANEMTIRVGIGGWSYEPWEETFYPEKLAATKQLEYAASKVTAIESNATFYRTQSAASFKKWAGSTPENFQFSVKAPRAAVQRKDLREAAQSIEWFFNSGVGELGAKLGPIFWQMAPYKKFDPAELTA